MSRAYDDAMDDHAEARQAAYVAGQLLISEEVLAQYPYEAERIESDEGVPYYVALTWQNGPPPGVDATAGFTSIAIDHSDRIDWPDDI